MKTLCYNIKLIMPVLATDLEGDPNSSVSLPYLPGSLLRGALIGKYLQQRGKKSFDAVDDQEIREIFLSNKTKYLNAYPLEPLNNQRSLPNPFSWFKDKNVKGEKIYDFSNFKPNDFTEKAVGDLFVYIQGSSNVVLFSAKKQIKVHNQRDAEKGRATEELGAIYRYEALVAGQSFQAVILAEDEHIGTLQKLLEGTLWLGRARRSGYGQAEITQVKVHNYWFEGNHRSKSVSRDSEQQLKITFTSDALLRDEIGQLVAAPEKVVKFLSKKLNVKLTLDLEKGCFVRSKILGGFNRKWGLPLQQNLAIAAGSVFCFKTEDEVSSQSISTLVQEGLGERRTEGFGRFLVNWHSGEIYESEDFKDLNKSTEEITIGTKTNDSLSDKESKLAKAIAMRLLRAELDRRLHREIGNSVDISGSKESSKESKNQLSRLRFILRQSQSEKDNSQTIDKLTQHIKHIKERPKIYQQYKTISIKGKPLLDWIETQLKETEIEKNWKAEIPPVKLGAESLMVEVRVDDSLAKEYALLLIDGVLYQRAKGLKARA